MNNLKHGDKLVFIPTNEKCTFIKYDTTLEGQLAIVSFEKFGEVPVYDWRDYKKVAQ